MKNILQVCAYAAPYPGNFINSLKKLADRNLKKGYNTIFAFPITAQKIDWCRDLEREYKIYYLPLNKARIYFKTYSVLKQIFQENDIEIAHSHFELYDIPTKVCAPKNTKVFWHLHDALDLIYSKSKIFHKLLWKAQYRYFGKKVKLLSVSEKGKKFAISLGFDKKNAFFVPNGIDTDRIRVRNISSKDIDYLMFGWDYYRKGVDILESVLKNNFCERNFVVINSDEKKIEFSNGSKLNFESPVSDVSQLYSNTKVFLHISRQEGLSYALLEAIYSGCLVICSDIDQNLFAKNIPTVHFVKVGDADDLYNKIKQIERGNIFVNQEKIFEAKSIIDKEYSLSSWINVMERYYFYE